MNARRLNFYSEPLEALHQENRKPEVKESYAVPSGSRENLAHVIRRVECLSVPFEKADVVEDTVELWLCSCESFKFNVWLDGYDPLPERVENVPGCKHTSEFKSTKAQSDDQQTQLIQ